MVFQLLFVCINVDMIASGLICGAASSILLGYRKITFLVVSDKIADSKGS